MNVRYLPILSALILCFAACKKTEQQPPHVREVNVTTTVSGRMQYPLFSQPVRQAKVSAIATKRIYYSNNQHGYTSFVMDSVYTDSNGNFSMTFNRDSFDCTYTLSCTEGIADTSLAFPAGDSTWMPLNLYKRVTVWANLQFQHRDSCWLYFYNNDTSGYWFEANFGSDTLGEPLSFYKDSVYRLCIKCDKNHVITAHTYTFSISSYDDTARRYLIVDPSTF